jgi:hypothetical protein
MFSSEMDLSALTMDLAPAQAIRASLVKMAMETRDPIPDRYLLY